MKHAAAALLLFAGLAFAQSEKFVAADVHARTTASQERLGNFLPNGRAEFSGMPLPDLISLAYTIPSDRVQGGPSWIEQDQFDVTALATPDATQSTMKVMLQNLLAERFALVVRREQKPMPALALTLAKPGVAKPASSNETGCKRSIDEQRVQTLRCRQTTIDALASTLPDIAGGYFNATTVNKTGLTGAYDFDLQYMARGILPPGEEGARYSLFNAIEKQLGIKVEPTTAPAEVLSIVSVNRKPTDNPPGTMEKLGPRPTEFEAATVKPSAPGASQQGRINNGRIDVQGMPLLQLLAISYDVEPEAVKTTDKWIETDKFDIQAKTAPTASIDTLRTMLTALLIERFHLKVRREPVTASVFELTADKPKLTKTTDPSARTTCQNSVADGLRTLACRNITMDQFVIRLRQAANVYLNRTVLDLTGLTGAYDITVNWSPINRTADGSDQVIGLTIFEAVERQLGLKLAEKKHPIPGVIIEHAEHPEAN